LKCQITYRSLDKSEEICYNRL